MTDAVVLANVMGMKRSWQSVYDEVCDEASIFKTERINCIFGGKVKRGEKDFIGQTMDELARTPMGKRFASVYADDWGRLRNKIIGHAIKCNMIDAFINGDYRDGDFANHEVIDCSIYFRFHAMDLMAIYLAYLEKTIETSAMGALENKVIGLLKKNGQMGKRSIQRRLTFYNSTQLNEIIQGLMEDGVVIQVTLAAPSTGGKGAVVYTLAS